MNSRKRPPWPSPEALDLSEGNCLLCSRPRYLDPTKGGCSCIGPTREQLAEIDARLAESIEEQEHRACLGILAAVGFAVLAVAFLFVFSWVVLS